MQKSFYFVQSYSRMLTAIAVVLFCRVLPAYSEQHSADLPQYVKSISTVFVLERISPNDSSEVAARRIAPIISIANKHLGNIGFVIRPKSVEFVESNPRESSYEAFLRIHSEWHHRGDSRDLVVYLMNGLRPDGKVGLSFPMTSCNIPNALVMVVYTGSGIHDARRSGQTLAHEIGHVLGAGHDDETQHEDGRYSLMYTYAPLEIAGFSEKSMREIERFADELSPSGSCYKEERLIPAKLEIQGPSHLELMDGEDVLVQFAVSGASEPVFLKPEGLPFGASYNVETGQLRLVGDSHFAKPSSHTLSLLDFEMVAETFSAQTTKPVSVFIHRFDYSPQFIDGPLTRLTARQKRKLSYKTSVFSPDGSPVKLQCKKQRGASNIKVRVKKNVVTVTGRYRRGETGVHCFATSANGLSSLKSMTFVGTKR